MNNNDKLIVANCSGFYGDRLSAAKEMVEGGPIDVLTGDYLAELTMAILFRKTMKNPDDGYASTFLKQMKDVMEDCLTKGIKVVVNAGGLSPKGLAAELENFSNEIGVKPSIAYIEGDNIIASIPEFQKSGEDFIHIDTGVSLKEADTITVTANAYLGGWGITKALQEGADIVIGGRIADAALVSGAAAWKFDWQKNDWDKIAGAMTAGHIIECGTQATGGNYSFINEVKNYSNLGFPIAEIYEDGSSVITKHPNTGGIVSIGTVKAQLLYEVKDPGYLTPDVIARFDTINISREGQNRVLIKDVKGEPPTGKIKVCCNNLYGHKNSATFVLTGLDIEEKAKILEEAFFEKLGGRDSFSLSDVSLQYCGTNNPKTNEEAFSYLRISVIDPDTKRAGKLFASRCMELALSNIPGFTMTTLPDNGAPAIQHWPALISGDKIQQTIVVNGEEFILGCIKTEPFITHETPPAIETSEINSKKTISAPIGRLFGTRSGDKGGNANLGVWANNNKAFSFLSSFLTTDKLKELLPDMAEFEIERYDFPNLLAVNFYIKGVLGHGVAASLRNDPQAKSLGEYLRMKQIDIPEFIADNAWNHS